MSLKSIIKYLYLMGCITLVYKAFVVGKVLYLTNTYQKEISYIQDGERWYTSIDANNLPLGILGGGAYTVIKAPNF